MSKAQRLLRLPNRIPVKTLADVRATIGKEDYYDLIFTLGKDTVNDGYASEYYWSATSTANDNDKEVIKPVTIIASAPGRWLRVSRIFNLTIPIFHSETFTGDGTTKIFPIYHDFNSPIINCQLIKHPGQVDMAYVDEDIIFERYAKRVDAIFNTAPGTNDTYTVMLININVTITT